MMGAWTKKVVAVSGSSALRSARVNMRAGGLVASAAVCEVDEDVGRGWHHLFIHLFDESKEGGMMMEQRRSRREEVGAHGRDVCKKPSS